MGAWWASWTGLDQQQQQQHHSIGISTLATSRLPPLPPRPGLKYDLPCDHSSRTKRAVHKLPAPCILRAPRSQASGGSSGRRTGPRCPTLRRLTSLSPSQITTQMRLGLSLSRHSMLVAAPLQTLSFLQDRMADLLSSNTMEVLRKSWTSTSQPRRSKRQVPDWKGDVEGEETLTREL